MDIIISNIRPNLTKTVPRFFFAFLLVLLFSGLSACRSSRKSQKNDMVTEMTIEKPGKKKDKGNSMGEKIVKEALTWQGTPYGYGRNVKGVSTDCSGMVMVVYEKVASIKLPRNSAQQADFCRELKAKDVKAGDLVFFATGKDITKISHVGIMIDDVRFVHASASKGVILSDMETPYYIRTFKKYGRVPME